MMSQFVLNLTLESIVASRCSVSFKTSVFRIFSRHFIAKEVMAIGQNSNKEVNFDFWGAEITVEVIHIRETYINLCRPGK